tara:strand:- start:1603 stop:2424 length:822 start_codon:yes stop_codon:yes gene_type:complete
MSNMAITWAMQQKTGSPTSKLILLKLADQANDDGKCWPSQKTMATHCEVNRATINRHIKKLAEAGLLEIIPRTKDGVSLPNVYRLLLSQQGVSGQTGVGAHDHRGGRTRSQGVGAHDHTNPHSKPSLNPHSNAQSDESLDAGSDTGQQSSAIAASRSGRPDPVIECIPLNTGDEYPVTQSQIDEWQRLFPAVDVGQAVREMRAWSASNASRRKTRRGIERFATNWLSREQDKGTNQPPGGPRGTNDSGHNAGRGQSSAAGFWQHFGSEAVGHG